MTDVFDVLAAGDVKVRANIEALGEDGRQRLCAYLLLTRAADVREIMPPDQADDILQRAANVWGDSW